MSGARLCSRAVEYRDPVAMVAKQPGVQEFPDRIRDPFVPSDVGGRCPIARGWQVSSDDATVAFLDKYLK